MYAGREKKEGRPVRVCVCVCGGVVFLMCWEGKVPSYKLPNSP